MTQPSQKPHSQIGDWAILLVVVGVGLMLYGLSGYKTAKLGGSVFTDESRGYIAWGAAATAAGWMLKKRQG